MRIRMHSFFGIGNKKIEKIFIKILDQIQEVYFNDMAIHYLQLLNSEMTYVLAGATLTKDGIIIKKDGKLIPWIRLGLTSYQRSCSIYDLEDQRHVRSFDYWHDWNAVILRSIVDYKMRSTTYELLK